METINSEDILTAVLSISDPPLEVVNHRVQLCPKDESRIRKNHYALEVDVEYNRDTEWKSSCTFKFFVKTPQFTIDGASPDSPLQKKLTVAESLSFLNETRFLATVFPHLTNKYYGPRWWAPCHLSKPEILIFEDARTWGYESPPEDSFLAEVSVKAVLSSLAYFHASALIAEKCSAEPLNRAQPGVLRERVFTDGVRETELGFDALALIARRFGMDGGALLKIYDLICELVKPRSDQWNVVCHGRLWSSNIMFGKFGYSKCILVDYRMVRYASPAVDVAMLLYVHTTPEFRRETELDMVEYYSSVFRRTLRRGRVEEANIPSYESLLEDYEKHKLVGMAYAALKWPPKVLDSLANDPVAWEKWHFQSRIDVYESRMNEDPVYENQMRDVLKELFDEGKRLLNL